MPIYEYSCEHCGERFQEMITLSKAAQGTECPKCGSKSVRKLMSTFASVSSKSDDGTSECPTCTGGVCDL